MATISDVNAVIAKAVAEPDFRTRLLRDPAAAAAEMNIALSNEQVQAVKQLGSSIQDHAQKSNTTGTKGGVLILHPNLTVNQ